jgi:hypothetical protein
VGRRPGTSAAHLRSASVPKEWRHRWRQILAGSVEARRAHDALNIKLLVVGSDKSFGAYISFLNAFEIPWAIICDGPVLSPSLFAQGVVLLEGDTELGAFGYW